MGSLERKLQRQELMKQHKKLTIMQNSIKYGSNSKKIKKGRREKIMNDRAKYTDVNDEQKNRIDDIRNMFSDVYDFIETNCKQSRETSLAITKLEEAQFWAIKGITREEN